MKYSVWVGGVEINSYYYETKEEAIKEYKYWKNKRYKNVYIEKISSKNSNFYNLTEFKKENK
jgi:hypothetical protein